MTEKTMTEKRQYTEEEILEAQKALMAAVKAGDAEQVKQVIEDCGDRIDPNLVVDKFGWTALSRAAQYGHTDIVEAFIKADHKRKFARRMSDSIIYEALQWAVIGGHTKTVEAFIEADHQGKFEERIDPNACDELGLTTLGCAAWKGHTKMAKVLIEADLNRTFAERIDLNATDVDGKTALDYAEYNPKMLNILKDFQKKQREQKLKQFTDEAERQDKKPGNTNNDGPNQLKL